MLTVVFWVKALAEATDNDVSDVIMQNLIHKFCIIASPSLTSLSVASAEFVNKDTSLKS